MTTSGFHALTLVRKIHEYDEVYSLHFEPEVRFTPGQYVHLLAPQSPPGRENVRHLSIASIPGEGPLKFTLDLAPTSEYKRKLAALEPGGKAHLFKVKGDFVLGTPVPPKVVFLTGGLGITPVRALIQQITRGPLPVEWRLAHVARDAFLYETELTGLGGTQVRLRRDAVRKLLDLWVAEAAGSRWYVSGSHRFVLGMVEGLRERGVPDETIRSEDFS